MNVHLIKIGNSQGIRIPKTILKQCGFEKTVNLEISGHTIIIKPANIYRKGWNESFKLMHKNKDDELLDNDATAPEFDNKE